MKKSKKSKKISLTEKNKQERPGGRPRIRRQLSGLGWKEEIGSSGKSRSTKLKHVFL